MWRLVLGFVATIVAAGFLWRASKFSPPQRGDDRSPSVATATLPETGAAFSRPPASDDQSHEEQQRGVADDGMIDDEAGDAPVERMEALAEHMESLSVPDLVVALEHAQAAGADIDYEAAKNHLIVRAKAGDKAALDALSSMARGGDTRQRTSVVRALGEIATVDALAALVDLSRELRLPQEREALFKAIGNIGRWRDTAQQPEPMSNLLEQLVATIPKDDATALAGTVRGLVTLGTERGIRQALQTIASINTDQSVDAKLRSRLVETLSDVRNPRLVPVFADMLRQDVGLTEERTRWVGHALAAMGAPNATRALIDWASGVTGAGATELAVRWLGEVRDPESLQLLLGVNGRQDFKDPDLQRRLFQLGTKLDRQAQPATGH